MDSMFRLPSRSHLSRTVLPNLAEKMSETVKKILSSSTHLSLTIDIWSDRRCHSFLAATAHSFKNFVPQSMLLSFVSIKGSHTGAKIAEELDTIIAKNGLAGRVDYVVTDNAANMKRAFTVASCFQNLEDDSGDANTAEQQLDDDLLWENLSDEDQEQVDTTVEHLCKARASCFAHTLQLVVKDGLDKVSGSKGQNTKAVMGKCTKIASLCHQSTQFKEVFEEKLGKGRSIPAANATRWSSTHAQLEAITNLESDKLNEVLRLTDQNQLCLSARDISMLTELVSILEPFAEATTVSQGETFTTVGCVAPSVVNLYKNLLSFQQTCKFQGTVVRALMDSLCSRFGGLLTMVGILDDTENKGFKDLLYPMSSILDPKYGFIWIEEDLQITEDAKLSLINKLKEAVIREAEKLCVIESRQDVQPQVPTTPTVQGEAANPPPPSKRPKTTLFSSYERRRNTQSDSAHTTPTSIRALMQKYFDEIRAITNNYHPDGEFDDDHWQSIRENREFQSLHLLFEKIFSVPATSAPVERIFSQSGLLMRPHRARLGDKMLSDLVFFKMQQASVKVENDVRSETLNYMNMMCK